MPCIFNIRIYLLKHPSMFPSIVRLMKFSTPLSKKNSLPSILHFNVLFFNALIYFYPSNFDYSENRGENTVALQAQYQRFWCIFFLLFLRVQKNEDSKISKSKQIFKESICFSFNHIGFLFPTVNAKVHKCIYLDNCRCRGWWMLSKWSIA